MRLTLPPFPFPRLQVLQQELAFYKPQLLQAPSLVIANKLDCFDGDARQAQRVLEELKAHTALPIVPISAQQKAGVQRLKAALRMLLPQSYEH